MVQRVSTVAFEGIDARAVDMQVQVAPGLPAFNAESYFSRLRRAEIGQHHHIAGPHLNAYAHEAAWREDSRRIDNGTQFLLVCLAAANHPVSRTWKGYWQRRAPPLAQV
jgi:hypothetical protein